MANPSNNTPTNADQKKKGVDEKHAEFDHHDSDHPDELDLVFRGAGDAFGAKLSSSALGPSLGSLGSTVSMHRNPTSEFRSDSRLGVHNNAQARPSKLDSSTTTTTTSSGVESISLDNPPTPPGEYLEPHHTLHVKSGCTPLQAFKDVMSALTGLLVDYSSDDLSQYRIHAYHYDVAQEIPFVVSLFCVNSNELVLEFQRRHGSISAFCELYATIAARLAALGSIADNRLPPLRTFRPRPLSSTIAPATPEEMKFVRDAVCALISMIKSEFLDVRVEGLYGVAQLSTDESRRAMIAELGKADLLLCLSHPHPDVHRSALTIIANLLETVKEVASWDMLDAVFLLTHGKSLSPQVIREAARLLRNYSFHVRPKASTHQPLVSTLKRLAVAAKDDRTKDYANGGLSHCNLDA